MFSHLKQHPICTRSLWWLQERWGQEVTGGGAEEDLHSSVCGNVRRIPCGQSSPWWPLEVDWTPYSRLRHRCDSPSGTHGAQDGDRPEETPKEKTKTETHNGQDREGGSAPLLLPPIWQGSRTAHLSYSTIWWMLNTSRQSPGIWSMYLIKLRLLNMLRNLLRQLVPTPIMDSKTKLHIVWKWKSLPSTLLLLECSSPAKWKETGILLLPLTAFRCCPPRLVALSLTFTVLSYSQGNWRALGRTCEKQHLEDWVTAYRQRAQFGLSAPEKPYFHSCHSNIFPFDHLHQPPSLLYPSQNSTSKCAYTCPAWMPSAWLITLSEQKR